MKTEYTVWHKILVGSNFCNFSSNSAKIKKKEEKNKK